MLRNVALADIWNSVLRQIRKKRAAGFDFLHRLLGRFRSSKLSVHDQNFELLSMFLLFLVIF